MLSRLVPSRRVSMENPTLRNMLHVVGFCLALTTLGCDQQDRGFNLPKGNVEQGRMTFILMQCNHCHSVTGGKQAGTKGVDWDGAELEGSVHVTLGGKVTRIKTYADLVTSIINPNHKLSRGPDPGTMTEAGESRMRDYNSVMSVQELIDLVAYLESKYEIWVPDYEQY